MSVVEKGRELRIESISGERSLVEKLRAAPLRVRRFGAGEVSCGDRRLDITYPQVPLLFDVHPLKGIKNETLGDMLWDDPSGGP